MAEIEVESVIRKAHEKIQEAEVMAVGESVKGYVLVAHAVVTSAHIIVNELGKIRKALKED